MPKLLQPSPSTDTCRPERPSGRVSTPQTSSIDDSTERARQPPLRSETVQDPLFVVHEGTASRSTSSPAAGVAPRPCRRSARPPAAAAGPRRRRPWSAATPDELGERAELCAHVITLRRWAETDQHRSDPDGVRNTSRLLVDFRTRADDRRTDGEEAEMVSRVLYAQAQHGEEEIAA